MNPVICLEHIEGKKYHVVDCATGKAAKLSGEAKVKRTRAPSKYNLHMKECLKGTTGPIKQRFRACAEKWRKK